MNKYEILWLNAIKYFGIMQNYYEIMAFMEYLDAFKPKNFMEIGIFQGATFFLWSSLAQQGGIRLGIDKPNGGWGTRHFQSPMEMACTKQRIEKLSPNTHVFFGDSIADYVIKWVKDKLQDEKLDFLFIDGDHSYEGVKTDYYNYKDYVREGGLIVFHDVKDTIWHREAYCNVGKFWKELQGPKMWFCDDTIAWGGIGVLIKED